MPKKTTKNVRLPKDITPIKYKIHLVPNLDKFTFDGEEEIEIKVSKSTKKITLHSIEIEILSAEIRKNKNSQKGKISYDEKSETATFTFQRVLTPGIYFLKLVFKGVLNDKMRGFYRSRYEIDDKTYHMGVTQFESTDARRAIPCFDEPSQKAVFEVSLDVPNDREVISNTIETEIAEHEGYKTVKFAPSPKMSSYLLAFIVGHFEKIQKKTKNGILVRVFVTPGKKKQAEFALDVATKVISFYEEYFGIKYPLPTADLIAIPDFAAGAMENWGAVTYRETAILVDPTESSTQNKQWVALVIAHELAHQWFGNLVTMEWWTHLWLNEGFASYMEYVAVNKIFPKWNVWSQFVYMDHARGLELDGLKSTHPIEVDVNHPAEISEIFDAVSYSKGASVIRMLAEYLGETNFRDGLRSYLKKHAYSNAKTNDLWKSLEDVSKKPVQKIMQNWTRTPGYPLISAKKIGNKLELAQKRFFSSSLVSEDKKSLWLIPIGTTTEKVHKAQYHLLAKKKTLIPYGGGWVKINEGETSFVRVDYSKELNELLEYQIKTNEKSLSDEDRFGIVRDAFAVSRAGSSSADEALKLVSAYKNEEAYIVWVEIISDLAQLRSLLYGTTFYEEYKTFCRTILSPIVKKIGWKKKENESHTQTLLRASAIFSLGANGDLETIKKAQELFKKGKVDADIRAAVYALVAENGGEAEYRMFMSMYKAEKMQEQRDRILRALCSFKEEKLLQRTMDFAFSDEVKGQDLFKAVALVSSNPVGRRISWNAVKKNWKAIEKKFAGGHLFDRFVSPAASFTTEKDAKEVEAFFKKNKAPGIERTVAQAIEQIRSNAAWLKRDTKKIQQFLKNK